MGPLIPLFRTSGDVSTEFQRQDGHPYSFLAEVYVLHIPEIHLGCDTCWWPAWQLSLSLPRTCDQALVGLKRESYHATGERSTDLRKREFFLRHLFAIATVVGSNITLTVFQ